MPNRAQSLEVNLPESKERRQTAKAESTDPGFQKPVSILRRTSYIREGINRMGQTVLNKSKKTRIQKAKNIIS